MSGAMLRVALTECTFVSLLLFRRLLPRASFAHLPRPGVSVRRASTHLSLVPQRVYCARVFPGYRFSTCRRVMASPVYLVMLAPFLILFLPEYRPKPAPLMPLGFTRRLWSRRVWCQHLRPRAVLNLHCSPVESAIATHRFEWYCDWLI